MKPNCLYRLIIILFWLCCIVIGAFFVGVLVSYALPLEDKIGYAAILFVAMFSAAAGMRGVK